MGVSPLDRKLAASPTGFYSARLINRRLATPMKSRARDNVGVGKLQIADWKSLILRDILDLASVVTHACLPCRSLEPKAGGAIRGYKFW